MMPAAVAALVMITQSTVATPSSSATNRRTKSDNESLRHSIRVFPDNGSKGTDPLSG